MAHLLPLADTGDVSIQFHAATGGPRTICELPVQEAGALLSKPPSRLRQTLQCGFQGECGCKGKVAMVTWRPLTAPQWWSLEASPFGAGPYQALAMHLGFPVAGTGHKRSERHKAWVKPMVTFTTRTTAAKRTRGSFTALAGYLTNRAFPLFQHVAQHYPVTTQMVRRTRMTAAAVLRVQGWVPAHALSGV